MADFAANDRSTPWHLTFDHAAEKVSDRDSSRSRVATIARQRIPAERLHPKATTWRSRPKPARRVSPKLPDAQPRLLAFRIYEAAVRDLQQPATSSHAVGSRKAAVGYSRLAMS